jgi:5'-deoxy-5'-methylthioadenosine phosphorylase
VSELAIIGGTGLTRLQHLTIARREVMHTPYGEPSGALTFGELSGKQLVFLARHGDDHTIPPHRVNYRANLWALKKQGIKRVLGVCAVGGIRSDLRPSAIVIPDQIIDYTWSRKHTFFESDLSEVTHVDFTEPYCPEMRTQLLDAAGKAGIEASTTGTYGASQGPRLETAAEIDRMERDGCHMVGMTGMPEAALARELDLCYAVLAVSANAAAGRGDGALSMEIIEQNLSVGMEKVRAIIEQFITTSG